jgi:predicted  nucleic acid-binding Zn-ribbon protein
MNEAQTNAALAALEKQRNTALNQVVNTEVALSMAQTRLTEVEKELREAKEQLKLAQAAIDLKGDQK